MIEGAKWNYEPCEAREVRVIVGPCPVPTWWCADLAGTERAAIEIRQGSGLPFYIDNDAFPGIDGGMFPIPARPAGEGMAKVLNGGGPDMPHSELPIARLIERQYVAVKFRTDEARSYTYHNDGEPVGAGQQVKVPSRGAQPGSDDWKRATVVEIGVPAPTKFETKGILGLAPLRGQAAE